ncbi:hypothetical protein [Hymenobacter canadensis]|uniref:BatC protein n=1 Tax=Hymenobacter canadensis TaxID=2999067 RepID=A0ABY7LTQ5_9BACT|nr:hypothetical protein [Hymenobacter canadensis]WBA43798.1 hypothetical protein O3303_09570 [Hymenobacter canadensis]
MSADQTPNSDQNAQTTPNAASEQEGRQLSTGGDIPAQHDADAQASGNPEATSTQQNMGDGSGIRGDYGNASQTNGAEGTDEANDEGAPKKKNDQWAE